MIGKIAHRMQSLMTRGDDRTGEIEPATAGLIARLRDEWNVRNDVVARPDRFGLEQLLQVRASNAHPLNDAPLFMREERADAMPAERLDAAGNLQPLDDAFFKRDRYLLGELTGFVDAVFVEVAFRCVLKRRPDPHGFTLYVQGLRSGSFDRIDILRGLAASREGQQAGVVIEGLARVAFWRRASRAPFAGPLVRWLLALARLPRLAHEQRVFQAQTLAWQQRQARHDATVRLELERLRVAIATLEDVDDEIRDSVVDLSNRLHRQNAERTMTNATSRAAHAAASANRTTT